MDNRISTVIITFNEEQNIKRCLKSVLSISDEIIIIDSGSQDKTEEIAKQFNVIFKSYSWKGYSKSKNYGHLLAKNKYILSIDADEELSQDLILEIQGIKEKGMRGVYQLNRLTNYCGKWIKHSGWYPDKKIRIFPKETQWNDAIVHEELILPSDIAVINLKGHLNHFSYRTLKDHQLRADKYSKLTAKKYWSMNKKTYLLQPYLAAFGRFFSMYFFKLGFLDGIQGWHIARISAASNYIKYKELRRLYAQQKH